MPTRTLGVLKSTKNNIFRNKWLSLATILVTTIVFTTASFFIAAAMISQRAVKVFEKKAQLQVYFQIDSPEEEVLKVKEKVEKLDGIEEVRYIDKQDALKLYVGYYSDDPDLIETVSADWLPASLDIRAKTLADLENITKAVKEEQAINPHIEDVDYHQDIVKQLKSMSKIINIGAIAIISVFSIITISLIVITIAFNIRSHSNEIEIMHLVGSSDSYIKVPFILEGTLYTLIGAILAASTLLVPWYIVMLYGDKGNAYFIINDILKELSLDMLRGFDPKFVAIFFGAHIVIGSLIGFVSSYAAVAKNLNLREK